MKVRLGETEYRVSWQYDEHQTTTCVVAEQTREGELFATGYAHLHSNDRFVKETGRRLSLARALHSMFPGNGGSYPEQAAKRRAFWDAYWTR